MLNYTTVEDPRQVPVEKIKETLCNPSEIVLKYQEYVLKYNIGVVMHPEDYAVLQERIEKLRNS